MAGAILFNSVYERFDTERRARHGCAWEEAELKKLKELFLLGYTLQEMCDLLQRPAKGVLPKLCGLRCIAYDSYRHSYYLTPKAAQYFADKSGREPVLKSLFAHKSNQPQAQRAESTTMNTITDPIVITEQTNINGQDLSKFTDVALYGIIHEQELKIAELDAIKNKPKSLLAEIDRRRAGIDALVEYMNAKFDAKNAKA